MAAASGAVLVKRVRAPGGQKVAASDYAASAGIAVGDRFTPPAKA